MSEERFVFTGSAKKSILITGAVGVVLLILGIFTVSSGGHGDHGEAAAAGHHAFHWDTATFLPTFGLTMSTSPGWALSDFFSWLFNMPPKQDGPLE